MQCSRSNWKLRVAAQLLAAGVLLAAAPGTRAAAQGPTGFSPGLIDTLITIAGAPRGIHAVPLPANWLGAYVTPADVILILPEVAHFSRRVPDSLATWETRISPDWILAHEFGHRFDRRRGRMPSLLWMRDAYRIPGTCAYANAHPEERWAEAFANAIDFLRFAAVERRQPVVLRSLAAREVFVPGTSGVVEYLLRQRIYRRHPLNRSELNGYR
ncbi:MAG: hypothetical protein ACSLFE_00475 [Gemmatimonadaceae bacterium]